MNQQTLRKALDEINWLYGRGEIIHVGKYSKVVTIKKQYGTERVSYRVKNKTVFFRGHQKKVNGNT